MRGIFASDLLSQLTPRAVQEEADAERLWVVPLTDVSKRANVPRLMLHGG
jgi:hypothetical protein